MQVLNPAVIDDIGRGRPIRLNIGCGDTGRTGFYGVDIRAGKGVDIVADLNAGLTELPDDCVEEVYSSHTLEHIDNLPGLMQELHRLVRHDGQLEIIVPHFSNPNGYSDPTHVRFFGLFSMNYFADPADQVGRNVPNYWPGARFRVEDASIRFWTAQPGGLLERLVNHSWFTRRVYERFLCWMVPAREVRFLLRTKKVGTAG